MCARRLRDWPAVVVVAAVTIPGTDQRFVQVWLKDEYWKRNETPRCDLSAKGPINSMSLSFPRNTVNGPFKTKAQLNMDNQDCYSKQRFGKLIQV